MVRFPSLAAALLSLALLAGCGAPAASGAASSDATSAASSDATSGASSAASSVASSAASSGASSGASSDATSAATSAASSDASSSAVPGAASAGTAAGPTPEEIRSRWALRGDYAAITAEALQGTWYDADSGERLTFSGTQCRCDLPWMGADNDPDAGRAWEIVDRSDRGLCPMLALHADGSTVAYYVSGVTEDCFWCNTQQQLFLRVSDR